MPSNKPADFCVPSLMAQPHPKLGSTDNSLSRMGVHCLRSRVHRFESCRGRHSCIFERASSILRRRGLAKPHLRTMTAKSSDGYQCSPVGDAHSPVRPYEVRWAKTTRRRHDQHLDRHRPLLGWSSGFDDN